MKNQNRRLAFTGLMLAAILASGTGYAESRIAILDFELCDITSLPNTKAELLRTAAVKPKLEEALKKLGQYEIVNLRADRQKLSSFSVGYLSRFHDMAAKLGRESGADWIIVGQHSKPSFLFSYLIAQVINVKNEKLVAELDIELKGNHAKVTEHSVLRLAKEIDKTISFQAVSFLHN
jgi:Protein of unknown function (DUF2380)